MRRKLKEAILHETINIPGISASLNKTLNQTTYPKCELTQTGVFVEMKHKGTTALIPITNFKVLVLE